MIARPSWLTQDCLDAAEGRGPRTQTIAVFRHAFFERWFARAHPVFPLLFFGPIVVGALWLARPAGLGRMLMGVFEGWLGFSLVEYLVHRFAMHRRFPPTKAGRLEAFLVHGYHHTYPRDRMRLVMPPMVSVPLAALLAALYVLTLGRLGWALYGGTLLGYIVYDETHYLLHHVRPHTALGRWLWRYHLLHHHTHQTARFGVSSPFWDWVFSTTGDAPRRQPRRVIRVIPAERAQPEH